MKPTLPTLTKTGIFQTKISWLRADLSDLNYFSKLLNGNWTVNPYTSGYSRFQLAEIARNAGDSSFPYLARGIGIHCF